MSAEDGLEEVLVTVRETFLYRIPPMQSSAGHYCKSWKLESPLKTAQLQVLAKGTTIFLRFLLPDGSLFAESVAVDIAEHGHKAADKLITPVSDSSRYFVTFILNKKTKRRVAIGFGFRERPMAFDMQAAVNDCQRRVCRVLGKREEATEPEEGSADLSAGIEVAGFMDDDDNKRQGEPDDDDAFDLGPLAEVVPAATPPPLEALALAGPPAVSSPDGGDSAKKKKKKKKKKKTKKKQEDDDEWGDFADAPVEASAAANDDEWGDFQ